MKLLSLCTGYGGLDLAVETFFDCELVACAEIDKYASIAIDKHFDVPNLGDIKTINWSSLGIIDIMTAGYPCQPFSQAGKRKGTNDERHIWPYIKEGISILRPRLVILENVRGHLSLGFKEVLQGLTKIGYDATWTTVRASDVGAPHRRERVFVFAEPTNTNSERHLLRKLPTDRCEGKPQCESANGSQTVANAPSEGFQGGINEECGLECCCQISITDTKHVEQQRDGQTPQLGRRFNTRDQMRLQRAPNPLDLDNKLNPKFVEYMMGLPEGWVTDLPISRSQQFKMLGNGVVPQQALHALEILWKMRHAV